MHTEHHSQPRMAGLSTQEREILDAFVASERPSFRVDDLVALVPVSRSAANQILNRLHRKGWLRRIKRGLYSVVPLGSSSPEPAVEDAWVLAMEIFSPCFISGWSAAEHWGFTEQIFNAVSVITTKPQRSTEQVLAGVKFRSRTLTKDKFFGAKKIWFGSQRVEIADPHRLVIDVLDDSTIGGGGRHVLDVVASYWKSDHADPSKLFGYAERFGRGTLFKRIGFTAERFGDVDAAWLESCRERMTAGVSKLDPSGPDRGKILTRWRLRLNIPVGGQ
jgi:predicted transcriptional regulator of viral defense system